MLEKPGRPYEVDAGGGAFYGPKIDLKIKDALGREWQCATFQLDFQLPERFELEYVGRTASRHRAVMIHRALLGSMERFIAVLIEHYAGAFPLWLAPVQARVLSVSEKADAYAHEVAARCAPQGCGSRPTVRRQARRQDPHAPSWRRSPTWWWSGKRTWRHASFRRGRARGSSCRRTPLDEFIAAVEAGHRASGQGTRP